MVGGTRVTAKVQVGLLPIAAPTRTRNTRTSSTHLQSIACLSRRLFLSTIRSLRNINQYYWADILYFKKQYTESNIKSYYTSTQDIKDVDIEEVKKENKFICINDYGSDEMPLSQIDDIIKLKLDTIFKNKSKYEK